MSPRARRARHAGRVTPPQPQTRYRVVVHELTGGSQTTVMDTTGDGFIAAAGRFTQDRMQADVASGGELHLLQHLLDFVHDDASSWGPDRQR